ncbi:MAG: hypothetical protein AAFY71_28740 [Bacteroidota bacterium]
MARQKGLIKYEGNLGGISHYKQKGVKDHLARLANGPSKEQIESDPAFRRTRENNNEFRGCALVGKHLRSSFAKLIKSSADSFITGRLVKYIKQVNLLDSINPRGQRSIALSLGPEKLKNFEFNRNLSLDTVFSPSFTVSENGSKNEATLEVEPFLPVDSIAIPEGATHFRILLAIATLSDYDFDPLEKIYKPVNEAENGLAQTTYSAYLPVDQELTVPTTLTATLTGGPTVSGTTSLATAVGIEFYQEVNGTQYLFAQGNATKFVEIFV